MCYVILLALQLLCSFCALRNPSTWLNVRSVDNDTILLQTIRCALIRLRMKLFWLHVIFFYPSWKFCPVFAEINAIMLWCFNVLNSLHLISFLNYLRVCIHTRKKSYSNAFLVHINTFFKWPYPRSFRSSATHKGGAAGVGCTGCLPQERWFATTSVSVWWSSAWSSWLVLLPRTVFSPQWEHKVIGPRAGWNLVKRHGLELVFSH